MEDKKTTFAIFLIILFVMVYSEMVLAPYSKPSPQPPAPATAPAGGEAARVRPAEISSATTPPAAQPAADISSAAAMAASPTVVIETGEILATINQLGARLTSLKLKNYKESLNSAALLELVAAEPDGPYPLGVYSGSQNDAMVAYTIDSFSGEVLKAANTFKPGAGQELRINFKGNLPDGTPIRKSFLFKGGSYLFNVELAIDKTSADNLWLEWAHLLSGEEDVLNPKNFTFLDQNLKIRHEALTDVTEGLAAPSRAKWISFDDKYFTASLVPLSGGDAAAVQTGRAGKTVLERARGDVQSGSFAVYVGPKSYDTLRAANYELFRCIDLGFFTFLAYPLLLLLKFFDALLANYGLAIVLLTLAVKGVFFPLTRASLKSMKAMQALQPEMKALRERIKDPTQLNQEVMALYKKHGVNPMGGCLPVLIQIPVFFGLYSALQNAIELRHAPYALWIKDLSGPERLDLFGINVPVMTLLMGVVMFAQQYRAPSAGMDPQQRKTMLIVSLIFPITFLIYPFPAGLALYMLINMGISFFQQEYLKNEDKAYPFTATAVASLAIFIVSFVLTLI